VTHRRTPAPLRSFTLVELLVVIAILGLVAGLAIPAIGKARETANRGGCVAFDCGEKAEIHPKFKKPVGERLARLALAQVYGRDIAARGPLLTRPEQKDGKTLLTFEHTGKGLKTSDGKPEVPGFAVAGADQTFHPATARITGPATVELTCAEVPTPAAVRYAWVDWAEPPVTLQNSDGLPAEPAEIKAPK